MFWLWDSWCFDCGAVDVLIIGQLVFWLWGSCCFDCGVIIVLIVGAVGVLIVGQLVFCLAGLLVFLLWAVGDMIVGQLVFWSWGSCAVRDTCMWWLWWHQPRFSPAVAKAHQWPYLYICWEDLQIWRENCELLGVIWWTANMRWTCGLGIERGGVRTFHITLSLIRSIQRGLGIGRNPHYWIRNIWWTFQTRAVVLKQLNLFAL